MRHIRQALARSRAPEEQQQRRLSSFHRAQGWNRFAVSMLHWPRTVQHFLRSMACPALAEATRPSTCLCQTATTSCIRRGMSSPPRIRQKMGVGAQVEHPWNQSSSMEASSASISARYRSAATTPNTRSSPSSSSTRRKTRSPTSRLPRLRLKWTSRHRSRNTPRQRRLSSCRTTMRLCPRRRGGGSIGKRMRHRQGFGSSRFQNQVSFSLACVDQIDTPGDSAPATAEAEPDTRPQPNGTATSLLPPPSPAVVSQPALLEVPTISKPFRPATSSSSFEPPAASTSALLTLPKTPALVDVAVLNVRQLTPVDSSVPPPVKAAAPPPRAPPFRSSSRAPPIAKVTKAPRANSAPTRPPRPKSSSGSGSERSVRRGGPSSRSSRSGSPVNYAAVPVIQRLARVRPRELSVIAEDHHPQADNSLPFSLASHLQL
jgi:hypothetical protein